MADRGRAGVDFIGPPTRLRLAAANAEPFRAARGAHWPESQRAVARGTRPMLRPGRDAAATRLRLDPLTPPGDYTVMLELADGGQREAHVLVEARPRLRVSPGALRLEGPPGGAASARLLIENRGNVGVTIGEALVTGVFDDDGIETALASTYRLDTDDVSKIVGNVFARLREAHGGLLRLRVTEGAGEIAPGERRLLVLETTLSSKLRRGHGYHGVLEIGQHGIAVELRIGGSNEDTHQEGTAQ
jgi:hypothetical protein